EPGTSPISTAPARIARWVVGARRMVPVATARRFTCGFRPMSTIIAIASGWEGALFLSRAFVNGSSRSTGVSRDTPPAGDALCQVEMSDARSIMYATRGSSRLRADWMRAGRDGKGDRSAARLETILLRATDRHAT